MERPPSVSCLDHGSVFLLGPLHMRNWVGCGMPGREERLQLHDWEMNVLSVEESDDSEDIPQQANIILNSQNWKNEWNQEK